MNDKTNPKVVALLKGAGVVLAMVLAAVGYRGYYDATCSAAESPAAESAPAGQ